MLYNYTRYCLLFLLLQSFAVNVFSQTKEIDSLRRSLYSSSVNDRKLSILFMLCEDGNSMDADSLQLYFTLAHAIAIQQGNKKNIIQTNLYKATYFSKQGELDSAAHIIDSSIAVLKAADEVPLKYRFSILKSNILIRSDKQKESMRNSLQLLHDAEQTNDYLTQIRAKISIGWAYMELNQFRQSLNWFFDAVKMENSLAEKERQPFLYSNIAAVYDNMFKPDSAIFFAKESLDLALKKGDLSYIANAYFIYAGVYNSPGGSTAKAEDLLQKGLQIRRQVGDPFYIVSDIFQVGLFYANNHEPEKGIPLVREGIAVARKHNMFEKLPILYTALANNYKAANDYANYGKTMDTLLVLQDSMYKKNSAEALAEMQTKYEVEKKENTIIQQRYDLTRKNFLIYSIAGLLAATLLFGFFFFQNRKKNQRLKLQAVEMEQKKKTTQAVMQAEEDERKRIAADLHDSVAQKMVVAKINLEALGNSLDNLNEQNQKVYTNISALLEESTTEVRKLSHSMMPKAFARSGLTSAVKEMLDKISVKNLKINFSAEGNFSSIKENTALMIYRIIQECVQNVLKHANATLLDISMIAEESIMDVIVEDNGIGFNKNELNEESSGIKNIRSRIEFLNGKLDINSNQGKGTAIAFYIPLQN